MTTPHPFNDLTSSQESAHQQCMLYLLGELDAKESAAFEQRMESSAELGEELLRQADIIAGVSTALSQRAIMPVSDNAFSRWSIVASIVAIAACLTMAVLSVRPHSLHEDSLASRPGSTSSVDVSSVTEDLLIARAWADSQLNNVADDFGFAELDAEDGLAMAEEPSDFDSTLSWMFIAVSTSTDSNEAGETNDG